MRADALTMTLLYDYYGELLTEKQRQPELKLGLDRLKLQIQREDNRQRLLTDGHIFYLEGWVPEADTARLEQLLEGYEQTLGCIARDRRLEAALGAITRSAQALTAIDGAKPAAETILRAVQELKE